MLIDSPLSEDNLDEENTGFDLPSNSFLKSDLKLRFMNE